MKQHIVNHLPPSSCFHSRQDVQIDSTVVFFDSGTAQLPLAPKAKIQRPCRRFHEVKVQRVIPSVDVTCRDVIVGSADLGTETERRSRAPFDE